MNTNFALIPFSQVQSIDEITPSVLFLRVSVKRFFGFDASGLHIYRPCDVHLYVLNCKATMLRALLRDRIAFKERRELVIAAIDNSRPQAAVKAFGIYRMYSSRSSTDTCTEDSEHSVSTLELSAGAAAISLLDEDLQSILAEIQIVTSCNERPSISLQDELRILRLRECRLRLYIVVMLDCSTFSKKLSLDKTRIDRIVSADFLCLKRIEQSDAISTVNNRLEYLLDMAEFHLREAALCGWEQQNGPLENFISRIINEYLIKMVSLLGIFFDNNSVIGHVKV